MALGAINMNDKCVESELSDLIEEYGINPYEFFHILLKSENPNLDFAIQNNHWAFIKNESWHSLNMIDYRLWSISDNGDLLWWNGEQVIAMYPRNFEFMSLNVSPKQFIRLVGIGKVTGIFPEDLWNKNA
ncbi:MAG: hypothetical protein ACI86C_001962 [Candidatus Latescibacterota bacterium]